jgi:hypothetical protein
MENIVTIMGEIWAFGQLLYLSPFLSSTPTSLPFPLSTSLNG